jgi:hypothetical protein
VSVRETFCGAATVAEVLGEEPSGGAPFRRLQVVRLLAEPREHVSCQALADSAVSYRHRRLR